MPAPRWLTDSACANKELVRAMRELASDMTEMGKTIGSRTKAARPYNAKGKALTKAANAVAALPDRVTEASLPQLAGLEAMDEDCYERIKLYVATGRLYSSEESDEWAMAMEGYEAR